MSEAVDELDAVVAALRSLLSAGVSVGAPVELVDGVRTIELARNLLGAAESQLLAAAAAAALDGSFGTARVMDVVMDALPIAATEVSRRVLRAESVTPRRTLAGEPLPPLLPVLAEAVKSGSVSVAHADVVLAAMDAVPPWCDEETLTLVERTLVQACPHETPHVVKRMAEQLITRLEQDGPEPPEPASMPGRGVRRTGRRDGSVRWVVDTDVLGDAAITAVLDSLAKPAPAEDRTPDPRTHTQRRHDGLVEAMHRLLRSGTLPATGGTPVTVVVSCTLSELQARSGIAYSDRGAPVPLPDLLSAVSAETDWLALVTDDHGAVLSLGRAARLATCPIRRALAARDGGCAFPGCDRPPAWCEAHHVTPWHEGGSTDIDCLCLLCSHHHAIVDSGGWQVFMPEGVPMWIPPPWIDPDRRPVRNTAHRREPLPPPPADEVRLPEPVG